MKKVKEIIKKINQEAMTEHEQRLSFKEYLDSLQLFAKEKELTAFALTESSKIGDKFVLFTEGATVEFPEMGLDGVRCFVARGSIQKALDKAIGQGKTELIMNGEHKSQDLFTSDIGYADLTQAEVAKNDLGIASLLAPITLFDVGFNREIEQRQKLGYRYALSIELDPETMVVSEKEVNDQKVLVIEEFDLKALAVVKTGANVLSDKLLFTKQEFNFNIMDTNQTNEIEKKDVVATEVTSTTPEATLEETPAVTPAVTSEIAPEVAPEVKPEATPEATPEAPATEFSKIIEKTVNEAIEKVTSNFTLSSKPVIEVTKEKKTAMDYVRENFSINKLKEKASKSLTANFAVPARYDGLSHQVPDFNDIERGINDLGSQAVVDMMLNNDDDRPLVITEQTTGTLSGGAELIPAIYAYDYLGRIVPAAADPLNLCNCVKLGTHVRNQDIYLGGTVCGVVTKSLYDDMLGGGNKDWRYNGVARRLWQTEMDDIMSLTIAKLNKSLLLGQFGASTATIGNLDGVVNAATQTLSYQMLGVNGLLPALDLGISVLYHRGKNVVERGFTKVGIDGSGAIAIVHPLVLEQLWHYQWNTQFGNRVIPEGLRFDEATRTAVGYRGITFMASEDMTVDMNTGLAQVVVTTRTNLAARLWYMDKDMEFTLNEGDWDFAKIGANTAVSVANGCVPTARDYQLVIGGMAYAKHSFMMVNITGVNIAPFGLQQFNAMTPSLGKLEKGIYV